MKIAVCDDQRSALQHVLNELKSICPDDEMHSFHKISDLQQAIRDGVLFDAVLMDIEWEGESKGGIDFAAELYPLSPKTKIIFVTGYPERYSQQIFLKNTNLSGFVAKPVDAGILRKNIDKIRDEIGLLESRKLILKFNGIVTGVDPDDILYIESSGHTATVHVSDGSHLCYEKLGDLAKRLPGKFMITHKSFLVNMDRIKRITREFAVLEKGGQVPISRSRYNEVRDQYFRYVGKAIGV